jgi:transposase
MQQNLIVGVDVSKSTLDLHLLPAGTTLRISNDPAGFKKCLQAITQSAASDCKVLVVMEHTGHYSFRFENFLHSHGIGYCKLAALQIKRSTGVTRGKTDRIDARRIADYAWLRRDVLTADIHLHSEVRELRNLFSLRSKLVRDRAGYITRLKELIASGVCPPGDFIITKQRQVIRMLAETIRQTEEKIKALIKSNADFKRTCELLQSIKGVGWTIAGYMIACTENFRRFKKCKKVQLLRRHCTF